MLYNDEAIAKRRKKEKNIKRTITVIVYIILVPLLIYNISLIFQAISNPRQTPSFFGIKTYVIISGSMLPELDIGDIVIVKDTEELQEGDIISFREGQSIITHRISKIITENEQQLYKTKGDNNNAEDSSSINKNLIEGKVIAKIPEVGKIALLLQNKAIIIGILILLYIYIDSNGNLKRRKEARRLKRVEHEERSVLKDEVKEI